MSDAGDGVWFRRAPRRFGIRYTPVTWQGWLLTVGLTPVLLATIFAGDPRTMRTTDPALFLKIRSMFGLSGAHLTPGAIAVLIIAEVAVFLGLIVWKSRPIRPLD
jgi:hypothetical protein